MSDAAAPYASAERRFTNELGNDIHAVAAVGAAPDKLCRLCLYGPDSAIESYTTRMELVALRDVLVELLGPPLTATRDEALTELTAEAQRLGLTS